MINIYFSLSTENSLVNVQGIIYSRIIFSGSLGLFIESVCTKILQARGNMIIPMIAQVAGSVINIILDVILIFGAGKIPALGITGAAVATVIGQWAAMMITLICVTKKYSLRGRFKWKDCREIYANGIGSIITQSLYTLYIIGLNMILKLFTEDAVTVLGIYYKIQSFFFIPLLGFQQVLLPLLRQIFLLVPLAWLLHFAGLNAVWWTFPVTEIIVGITGILTILILHKQDRTTRL